MKTRARDLRRIALASQNKHYWWAILITLTAMLLGGTAFAIGTTQPQLNFNIRFSINPLIRSIENLIYNMLGLSYVPELDQIFNIMYRYAAILNIFMTIGSIAALLSLAALFIAGPMKYGYSRWSLQMIDASPRSHFSTLFSGFKKYGKGLGMQWWIWLKLFLWSLLSGLFVFIGWLIMGLIFGAAFAANPDLAYMDPGAAILTMIPTIILMSLLGIGITLAATLPTIIASYRYSLSYYLIAENPNMPVTDAVNCSKRLMKGNKWRLFCLHLSFIGWDILNALSFRILGLLFLNAYHELAVAAFYRDLVPANPASQLWNDRPVAPRGYQQPRPGYAQQPVQQQPVQQQPVQQTWQPQAAPVQQPADPFANLPKTAPVRQPDWGTPPEAPDTTLEP